MKWMDGGKKRKGYQRRVMRLFAGSLAGYWPLSEESGTAGLDLAGAAEAFYSGVTPGVEGMGDGRKALGTGAGALRASTARLWTRP